MDLLPGSLQGTKKNIKVENPKTEDAFLDQASMGAQAATLKIGLMDATESRNFLKTSGAQYRRFLDF